MDAMIAMAERLHQEVCVPAGLRACLCGSYACVTERELADRDARLARLEGALKEAGQAMDGARRATTPRELWTWWAAMIPTESGADYRDKVIHEKIHAALADAGAGKERGNGL